MSAESDFLTTSVKALVSEPESILVEELLEGKNVTLTVRAVASDMSILIGREGRTAGALRILCRAIAARHGRKASLIICEPS